MLNFFITYIITIKCYYIAVIVPCTYSSSFYVGASDHNLVLHPKLERSIVSGRRGHNPNPNPNPNSRQDSNCCIKTILGVLVSTLDLPTHCGVEVNKLLP